MTVADLLEKIDYIAAKGNSGCMVDGVVCDSRQVRSGYLFVAISGYKQEGWGFVGSAIDRGATVIVSEHGIDDYLNIDGCDTAKICNVYFVQVKDSKLALAELSSAFNGNPSQSLEMIGITGTNGKTTTAYLIEEILTAADKNPGMLTTVKYDVGQRSIPAVRTTPEAPVLHNFLSQMQKVGCRSAVMEVSSHSIVQKRIAGIDFSAAVFTNLTRDHLDYHKTMAQYFAAKAKLFYDLGHGNKPAVAVINIDDEWGRKLVADSVITAEIITYGVATTADVRAYNIKVTLDGCDFTIDTPSGSAELHIKLLGRFNISNTLAAIAAGIGLGIDLDIIVRAISGAECVAGRLEVIKSDSRLSPKVFVDYAHTDDALMNVLQTLREITKGKLFVVFGCGGDRDCSKRPAMGKVAEELADYSILTSDNPRTEDPMQIIKAIAGGFKADDKYEIIEDRRQAIIRAISLAHNDDVVLVAGKGHECFQVIGNKSLTFDDRQVVRDIIDGEN